MFLQKMTFLYEMVLIQIATRIKTLQNIIEISEIVYKNVIQKHLNLVYFKEPKI